MKDELNMFEDGFVLDCSVTMTWLFKDEITDYTQSILKTLDKVTAFVPMIWLLEVDNVLLMAEKKQRITHLNAIAFKNALKQLSIQQEAYSQEVYEIAREFQLTAYDASYLCLALSKNSPIATLDKALLNAAKKSGISLYIPT